MSNKKKFEKNITKKLEKMYAAAKKNPNVDSRLLFVSGKYGFSVIRMEEKPGSGKSFVDFADLIMSETVINALSASNTSLRQNIGSVKVSMYDGDSLARSFDAKRSVFGTPVDYAKMQGIDLDEASDRQRDNYVDHSDGRKAVIMHVNGTNEGLKFKNLYEQSTTHIEKLKQELKEAHEKAAEDRKKIEELEKKVLDAGKNLTFCYAKNTQLQKEKDAILAQLSAIKEDREERDKFCDKMNPATNEDTNVDPDVEVCVDGDTVPNTDRPIIDVSRRMANIPVHNDDLPDDYVFELLSNTHKPYSLRTIFRAHYNIYKNYNGDICRDIMYIDNPVTTRIRNYPRAAYAAAIALAVPESYVGRFINKLIEDYKSGDFKPTDIRYVPGKFPEFLKGLTPDIARMQHYLHTNVRKLPVVYTREILVRDHIDIYNTPCTLLTTKYYLTSPCAYNSPYDMIGDTDYIAVPRSVDPYDFLEDSVTRDLVMTFYHESASKRKPIRCALNDVESEYTRTDGIVVMTLKDQIDKYIAADKEGLIDIGSDNVDDILKNKLWFYPVIEMYRSFAKNLHSTNTQSEISSEPKQDSNEK